MGEKLCQNPAPALVGRNPVEIELNRVPAVQGMDVGVFDPGADVGDVVMILIFSLGACK